MHDHARRTPWLNTILASLSNQIFNSSLSSEHFLNFGIMFYIYACGYEFKECGEEEYGYKGEDEIKNRD